MVASTCPVSSAGVSDQLTFTISTSSSVSPALASIAPTTACSTPATEKPILRPLRSAMVFTGPSALTIRQFSGVPTSVPTRTSGSPS